MRIEIEIDGPPIIPRSVAQKMSKREFKRRGETWARHYKDPHFSPIAYSRYGYQKRSRKYNFAKQRRFKHTRPLEYTGTSRRLSKTHKIIATKRSVVIQMPVRVFNLRSKLSKIDKRKEFTTVAPFENKRLDRDQSKGLTKRINNYRNREIYI